ncbi:hypothetical protein [Allobranchiibius huperziae]|uniref:Uncharacterized protein n=1 Tax=Allobranchiibius huperziae TaxID=1874116 RepID=A0A853DMJ1_9MICO|nr:hypothetical protein [Allobranchiibius huperziae]NYJ75345.1 hypothetical protein [Allobranchiibius huperziae]
MFSRATRLGGPAALAVLATSVLTGCSHGAPAKAVRTTVVAPSGCSGPKDVSYSGGATAYDVPVPTPDHRAVATQVGAPTLSQVSSGESSYRIASVHMSARVVQNGSYVVSPGSLVMLDPQGRACPRPAHNPLAGAFPLTTIDEQRGADGNVAFLVPADADLANYSVVYVENPTDRRALAKWSKQGTAPQRTVTDACDGPRTAYDRKGVATVHFGRTISIINGGIGVTVTAQAPTPRTLGPSPTVPGDVDGVAVSLSVTARGAEAYVDRRQFVLLDGGGRTCRFGSIPSPGETLTSTLVKPNGSGRYTIIFWVPKGAQPRSWTLLQLTSPTSKRAAAAWSTSAK